jgi:hypothetical protein
LALLATCGLPTNENPEFESPAEADLDPDELVIGIELDGVARAYPIEAMAPLEILNDQIGDRPIAITWCPLSASSAIFDREIEGQVLTFRFHPDLFKFNLLIEDLETDTRWSQLAMGAIGGDLDGRGLELLPSLQTTWEHWYRLHPNTVVMRPTWGGHRFDYRPPGEPGPDGLGPKSVVHLVWVNGDARAYPLEELGGLGEPLADEVGGRSVIVHYVPHGPTAVVTLDDGSPVPGITLYREYVPEFYPAARLWRGPAEAASSPVGGGR